MEEPIRVLHVLGTTQLGGAESRIMDLYRHIDRDRVQFDFLVHTDRAGYFDEEILRMGGRIFRIPRFRMYNYVSYRKAVKDFFKEHHEFRMVQGHITSTAGIYLPIAKKSGVPVTIAHARSAGVDQGAKGALTRLLRRNLSRRTDMMFTCSGIAGISVFGEKAVREKRTVFIPNAIDCSAFDYNEEKRQKMREELQITDQYVIGHVGRFHYAKNHEYLLEVFAALVKAGNKAPDPAAQEDEKKSENQADYVLLLLGEGERMESVREQAKSLQILDKVIFAGNQRNVCDYYQAMDYFVYPSRFEGLPGTVVEAQVSGLRCLISDSICEEVAVTELVHKMSIGQDPARWAEYILETKRYERRTHRREMARAGFDVKDQAETMMRFYETGKWE